MSTPPPPISPSTEPTTESVRTSRRRRRARRAAWAALALAVAWLMISYLVAYKLTQRKRPPYPEPPPVVAWGALESHRLVTDDGRGIGAWYAEGADDAPSVLFLHGNGGDRAHCLSRAEILKSKLDCASMFISLRAHGDSDDDFNDIGYSARREVIAAVDYLRARRPGRPVIVFGVSLGSAAAAFASGELGGKAAGYILESPYQDLKTAVWNRTRAALPFPLSDVAYLGLRVAALVRLPYFDAISPVRAIEGVPQDVPVLILAGGADHHATAAEAEAIHEQVQSHGRIEVFPTAGHNDLATVEPERYARLIVDFCAEAAGREPVGRPPGE